MRNPLASPRFRRRLYWTSTLLGIGAGVAGVAIAFPHPKKPPEVFSNAPPQLVSEPQSVPADHARRVEVLDATLRFVSTAVRRDHVDASWTLVDPSLKQGFTREQWAKGDIPVVPFPAGAVADWKIDWSYANDIALDVALLPVKGSNLRPKTFLIELERHGARGHWLVSSWMPRGVSVSTDLAGGAGEKPLPPPRTLGGKWLLFPLLGLAAVFLVPLGVVAARGWLRGIRAERAYRRSLEADSH